MKLVIHHIPHTCSRIAINLLDNNLYKYCKYKCNISHLDTIDYIIIRDPVERLYKEYQDMYKHYNKYKSMKYDFVVPESSLVSLSTYIGNEQRCNVFCKHLMNYRDFNKRFSEEDYSILLDKLKNCIIDFYSLKLDFKNLEKFSNINLKKYLPNYNDFNNTMKCYNKTDYNYYIQNDIMFNLQNANSFDIKLFKELNSSHNYFK